LSEIFCPPKVDKLHEEMMSLTARKELLASGMAKVTHRHQEQVEQVRSIKKT